VLASTLPEEECMQWSGHLTGFGCGSSTVATYLKASPVALLNHLSLALLARTFNLSLMTFQIRTTQSALLIKCSTIIRSFLMSHFVVSGLALPMPIMLHVPMILQTMAGLDAITTSYSILAISQKHTGTSILSRFTKEMVHPTLRSTKHHLCRLAQMRR